MDYVSDNINNMMILRINKFINLVDQYYQIAVGIYRVHLDNIYCNKTDENFIEITKNVIVNSRAVFYKFIGFNIFVFPIFEFLYTSTRAVWTITPVLVLSFGLNISIKFEQFSDRLIRTRISQMTKEFWTEMYHHYAIICDLIEYSNSILSPIILNIVFFDFIFLCEKIYRQFS